MYLGQTCNTNARRFLLPIATVIIANINLLLATAASNAQETSSNPFSLIPGITGSYQMEIVQFAVFAGAMSFAILAAFWLIKERARAASRNRDLVLSHADLKARYDRDQALLNAPDQRLVLWSDKGSDPQVLGSLPRSTGAPSNASSFLAFGTWLEADSARIFDRANAGLRENAESFDLTLTTGKGSAIEAQGRTSGAFAFVRFIPLSGERAVLANLEMEHTKLLETFDTVQALFEAISMPVWLRDHKGELIWANGAYAAAVDAKDGMDAVVQGISLLDKNEREAVLLAHSKNKVFQERVPAIISGDRRMLDVVDVALEHGSAGIASDIDEVEQAQFRLKKTIESHTRTLDQLTTAVAIFDSSKHLRFYNAAFQDLWDIDPAFLDSEPDHGAILNNLRTARKLPEQQDWGKWKGELFGVYQAVDPVEHWWYLPDGRTLRVIATPHAHDEVTWIFENVTEQLDLKSRYNALIQVQGETLDHLTEAVAVFAPDGHLSLSNPTFLSLWELDGAAVGENVHISAIARSCAERIEDPQVWIKLQTIITGLADERGSIAGRMNLINGSFVDYAVLPLPNGQTMLTFVDVSAGVKVENALVDRNEALQQADHLKNAFIEHVSYELRSPLTNIIGFSELLGTPEIGKLNVKQNEYLDHIATSSSSLLALINNILDLATVDAGVMELELSEIDIPATIDAAREGVLDRMRERGISLDVKISQLATPLIGDENRVRQVLFNLLSNAVTYSLDGGTISLSCTEDAGDVVFSITDNGNGIPKEIRDSVFNRFESHSTSHKRGGAGLGLAIVKSFVELHGGTTELSSQKGKGTTVTCRFPFKPSTLSQAAE
jgi:signal transduction histidine kinase